MKIKILPTFHPSFILSNWPMRPVMVKDLEKAKSELEGTLEKIERWLTINPTLEEIKLWFDLPADNYAIDIESGRALFTKEELKKLTISQLGILSRLISMIGFSVNKSTAIVIPFMTRNSSNLAYWPDKVSEVKALKLVKQGLQKPIPKIFQNGLYDIPMLLSYGLLPKNCIEDTMLLHHSLYPEMPKRLGFLGSLYANERAWKMDYAGGETLKKED